MRYLVVLLLLLLGLPSLSANALTGRELYAWCSDSTGSEGDAACAAYISGVYDGAMAWWAKSIAGPRAAASGPRSTHDAPVCVPPGITIKQTIDVARGYLAANPQLQQVDAYILVLDGLALAFPCGRSP